MARNQKPAADEAKKPEGKKEAPTSEARTDVETVATEPAVEPPMQEASIAGSDQPPAELAHDEQASAELLKAVKELADTSPPVIPGATVLEDAPQEMVAVITATVPRRRRAGRSFGPTPVRIPVDQLTDDDFDALADDPVLKIHMEPAEDPVGE